MNPEDIRNKMKKGSFSENEPMNLHTTFRAGGPARYYAVPCNEEELLFLLAVSREEGIPFYIIGNGSNLLVSDRGFQGLVIDLGKNDGTAFSELSCKEDGETGIITAGAGCLMSAIGHFALENSLTGFEPLSGIPGCAGGAAIMNAGAYGGEVKDVIESVRAILPDGNLREFGKEELSFRYRGSSLSDAGAIVTRVTFRLAKGKQTKIKADMDEYTRRRKEKQPLELPSAGSTFKRPEGYFAGKLIEDAGLKGKRIGGASVSEKHAGFVVNDQGGTASDIYRLIQFIEETVYAKSGVRLEPEVKMIGDFS